jgi:hypothetical protein
MSHHRPRFAFVLITSLALTACAGAGSGASTDKTATSPTNGPSDGATAGQPSASAAASRASSDPLPSDELHEFSCELPIVEDPSVPLANITDVRVAGHDGFDRVAFEFEQGTPELSLDRAVPPFTQDASGEPIVVDGTSFLRLTMRGGSKQTDANTSSYNGPTDFDPGLPILVDLVEGGDFERQSTWYFGLTRESCVRLMLLADPARLVIDIEH